MGGEEEAAGDVKVLAIVRPARDRIIMRMAALQLHVPDDLQARLQARAKESGFKTVEEYAQAVLKASAEEEVLDDDLEALLIERLGSSAGEVEFTQQFKDEFRQQVEERRRSSQGK